MPDQTPAAEHENAGKDHDVPADLLELHGILEYAEHERLIGHNPNTAIRVKE